MSRLAIHLLPCLVMVLPLRAGPQPVQGPPGGFPSLDRAAIYYHDGKFQDALDSLASLSPAPGSDPRYFSLEGLCLHRLHRDKEAIPAFRRALAAEPNALEDGLNLALALEAEGLWSEAQDCLEHTAASAPARPEPWLGLGMLAASRLQWPAARKAFEKASQLDPKSGQAWLALSDSLLHLGLARDAALARDKAETLGPAADTELRFKQAALWYSLGELDRSLQELQASGEESDPAALFLRGCLSYRQGDFAAAEGHFRAALLVRDAFAPARLNLGITLYARKDYDGAIAAFKDAAARDPADRAALQYLQFTREAAADAFLDQGLQASLERDIPGALAAWEKAKAYSDNPAELTAMQARLRLQQAPMAARLAQSGASDLAQGNLGAAVEHWNQALLIDPNSAEALAGLKRAESSLAPLEEAYAAAVQSSALRDDFRGARLALNRLRQLDPSSADREDDKLKAVLEERVASIERQARADHDAGRIQAAIDGLDTALALEPGRALATAQRAAFDSERRRDLAKKLAQANELSAAGDDAEALRHAEEARDLDSADLEAQRLCQSLRLRLRITHERADQARSWYYEGVYAYGAGRTRQALALWLRAQQSASDDPRLSQAIATARLKLQSLAALEGAKP
jgi:tetratricopeptide (TPR) repeat protein